jgi:hypothetical protein
VLNDVNGTGNRCESTKVEVGKTDSDISICHWNSCVALPHS